MSRSIRAWIFAFGIIRAYFRVALTKFGGIGNLECSLRSLEVNSTFLLSYASYFAEVFLPLGLHILYAKLGNTNIFVLM